MEPSIEVVLQGRPELAPKLAGFLASCEFPATANAPGTVTIVKPAAERREGLRFVLGVFQRRHDGLLVLTRDGRPAALAA